MKKNISIITLFSACVMLTACSKTPESPVGFEDLSLVKLDGNRVGYWKLDDVENDSDLIVVGEFVSDAEQTIDYEYSSYFGKEIVTLTTSTNTLQISKVIKGDAKEGDRINVSQYYGVVDEQLISISDLTPMQNGDEWLFFLRKGTISDNYWCCGDSDGRYPVPSAENAPMPLSDSPDLGVYNEENFNRDIYNEIIEKYGI